jgi:hypothetical protein
MRPAHGVSSHRELDARMPIQVEQVLRFVHSLRVGAQLPLKARFLRKLYVT